MSRSIGQGATKIFIGKAIGLVIAFLSLVTIPRWLGPEQMGYYSYWLAIFFILVALYDLGNARLIQRYISEFLTVGQEQVKPFLKRIFCLEFLLFGLIILVGSFYFSSRLVSFLIIAIGALLHSLAAIIQNYFYAQKSMGKFTAIPVIINFSRWLGLLVLVFFFKQLGILLAIILGAIIVWLSWGSHFLRQLPQVSGSLAKPFKFYFLTSLTFFGVNIFFILTNRLAVPLAETFLQDLTLIGYLGTALLIVLQTLKNFTVTLAESILPSLVDYYVQEAKEKMKVIVATAFKYTNLLVFPLIFGLAALIEPFIYYFIGADYLPTTRIIIWLLPALLFLSWYEINNRILIAEEKIRTIFLIQLTGFLVFIILSLALISQLGIIALPLALSLAALVNFILSFYYSHQYLAVKKSLWLVARILIASWLMYLIISLLPVE